LLDDLLDVNRVSRNKLELRKTRLTLEQIVQSAIETSRSHIDDAGHDLTARLPIEPTYIEADAVRLAQVFLNLHKNAAKFTQEGGKIWLSAERQGNQIAVSVKTMALGSSPKCFPKFLKCFRRQSHSMNAHTRDWGSASGSSKTWSRCTEGLSRLEATALAKEVSFLSDCRSLRATLPRILAMRVKRRSKYSQNLLDFGGR